MAAFMATYIAFWLCKRHFTRLEDKNYFDLKIRFKEQQYLSSVFAFPCLTVLSVCQILSLTLLVFYNFSVHVAEIIFSQSKKVAFFHFSAKGIHDYLALLIGLIKNVKRFHLQL